MSVSFRSFLIFGADRTFPCKCVVYRVWLRLGGEETGLEIKRVNEESWQGRQEAWLARMQGGIWEGPLKKTELDRALKEVPSALPGIRL